MMRGDPSCSFCERLNNNEPDAIVEAVAYTNENFPDINQYADEVVVEPADHEPYPEPPEQLDDETALVSTPS